MRNTSSLSAFFFSVAAIATPMALAACSGGAGSPGHGGVGSTSSGGPTPTPVTGVSSFVSAPPGGASGPGGGVSQGASGSASSSGGVGAPTAGASAPASNAGAAAPTAAPRTVQETDLYRLEGTRLYYLNAYRGLMVFDVTNVDQPKLLGRSAIFGSPVEMIVQNGIAIVVVADWYGLMDNGDPFHGSIVRGLDATDPTNIKVLGEARLGGDIQDTRVVGNVLYAVSEDYGWVYGAGWGGVVSTSSTPNVIVSSVSFANNQITQVASKSYLGYGGVFNVTPNSILLAYPDTSTTVVAPGGYQPPIAKTDLEYLDISDPNGAIVSRGAIQVDGAVAGWGADNGRWNLDFADGKTAHVLGCADSSYGCDGTGGSNVLVTVDFTNPDVPKITSELDIPSTGWQVAARFDSGRMYLSPGSNWSNTTTPLEIFDLTNPAAPALAGQTQIPGNVWLMMPSGNQLFALGQDQTSNSSQVSLNYLDVTNAAAPALLGTSEFGNGWAWTPAADTFKAFTMDATKGLVVLPFSGWDATSGNYNNGVQLIEFTPTTIATAGAAHTTGWVERGIFVGNRIVSLSDLALSVVDYTNPLVPQVTAQLTLARNVIASSPGTSTIAEVSGDWWDNDLTYSEVRVLPVADAAENFDESSAPTIRIAGADARVFTNGPMMYVVTAIQKPVPCATPGASNSYPTNQCSIWLEQVQVIDTTNGGAKPRGTVTLPANPNGWYWNWGWDNCYWCDWYDGSEIVQVGGNALAFRRWEPYYGAQGQYVDSASSLFVVDLSNPDAPAIASTVITTDLTAWWGNMQVVGNTLYVSHYDWETRYGQGVQYPTVRYYLDPIDLSDRSHPAIGARINVPGMLVGGSAADPSVIYTIDYGWDNAGSWTNDLDVLKIDAGLAHLQSVTHLNGWVGNVFVQGTTAYTSTQQNYTTNNGPQTLLHQIDLSNLAQPIDRVVSGPNGWGWLLGIEGDRMLVTSGWGPDGLDIYKLTPNAAPVYDQFVRTRGWWINSAVRQANQIFLSSGYWGVQPVTLQ